MDYTFYKELYFDLKNFTDEQLKTHYHKYGSWEEKMKREKEKIMRPTRRNRGNNRVRRKQTKH